jgi:hypothetical protein
MSAEPTSLEFLQAVYRNDQLPLSVRMRAAIEAAPYEHAKLTAMAVGYINGDSFGAQLDRAIERSRRPMLLIEGKAELVVPAEDLKRPFPRMRRRI